jgi:hypothetical protein
MASWAIGTHYVLYAKFIDLGISGLSCCMGFESVWTSEVCRNARILPIPWPCIPRLIDLSVCAPNWFGLLVNLLTTCSNHWTNVNIESLTCTLCNKQGEIYMGQRGVEMPQNFEKLKRIKLPSYDHHGVSPWDWADD